MHLADDALHLPAADHASLVEHHDVTFMELLAALCPAQFQGRHGPAFDPRRLLQILGRDPRECRAPYPVALLFP